MKSQPLLTGMVFLGAIAASAVAMDGKAAVVNHFEHAPFWGSQPANRSKLMVVTVAGNIVTNTDTILGTGGRYYHPIWSFDGKRIAFYRTGEGVCVIDANGANLRVVARTPDWGGEDQEQGMSWPGSEGGKWLYYHRPCGSGENCFNSGSGEIWKVNVDDTVQKSLVCDYKTNQYDGATGAWFERFSLNVDAKYAVTHTAGVVNGNFAPGVICHSFPPQSNNPNLSAPECLGGDCGRGSCNSALSASGEILFHFDGSHTGVYANYWDHTANSLTRTYTIGTGVFGTMDQYKDMDPWLQASHASQDVGSCLIWPRGAVNSDQIVTVVCAYRYGAEIGHNSCGSNLVVANWKDKQAVMVTNNPEPPHPDGWVPDGTDFRYVDPGDFWLQPPAGKPGCYEAIDGTWMPVSGADTTPILSGAHAPRAGIPAGQGRRAIYNLRGSRIAVLDAASSAKGIGHGAYVVAGNGATSQHIGMAAR